MIGRTITEQAVTGNITGGSRRADQTEETMRDRY